MSDQTTTPTPAQEHEVKRSEEEAHRVDDLIQAVDKSVSHDGEAPPEIQVDYSMPRSQRVLGPQDSAFNGFDRTYVQRRLSHLPKLEFIGVGGKALKRMVADVDLDDLGEYFEVQDEEKDEEKKSGNVDYSLMRRWKSVRRRANINMISQAVAALGIQAPDLVVDIYMISLGVPHDERPIVRAIWGLPEEEDGSGGLSDTDGLAIMRTFVAQNSEALVDFFREAGEMVSAMIPTSTPDSDPPA